MPDLPPPSPARTALLAALARRVAAARRDRPLRVAIDGVDGAGKTVLADELAPRVEALGRPVLRASVDGFHRPRADRHARGRHSAEGYYRDSFDHAALRAVLLDPLGPGGDRRVRTRVFDHRVDAPVDAPVRTPAADVVLLVDGVFLQRPELRDAWDLTVFLQVTFDESVARARRRDAAAGGDPDALAVLYAGRYVPGQELYLREADPGRRADVLIDHGDPQAPCALRGLETDDA